MISFPLSDDDFYDLVDDVGINPPVVINRGVLLVDSDGFPVRTKHAVLAEWSFNDFEDYVICCCTIKAFRRDGKLLFSSDLRKGNQVLYAVMKKHDRVVHSVGTMDSECTIIEYRGVELFSDKDHYELLLDSFKDQLRIKDQTITSLLKVSKDGFRYVREAALETKYRTEQKRLGYSVDRREVENK